MTEGFASPESDTDTNIITNTYTNTSTNTSEIEKSEKERAPGFLPVCDRSLSPKSADIYKYKYKEKDIYKYKYRCKYK